jgi:hypothetical protein
MPPRYSSAMATGKKKASQKKASKKKASKKKASKKKVPKKKASKKKAAKKKASKKKAPKKKAPKKKAPKKKAPKKKASKKKASKKRSRAHEGLLSAAQAASAALRAFSLTLPETREDFPWDHAASKVRKKVFAFHDADHAVGEDVRLTVKLPHSGPVALSMPFATPTGYGLGKHGWVSLRFTVEEAPPTPLLESWIRESYRAVAPKTLAARLDEDD